MQDETPYGAPALSIEAARDLVNRVAAVIEERDELRCEVRNLRLIVSEIQSLYEFINTDPAIAMATATTNGSMRDPAADDERGSEARRQLCGVQTADDDDGRDQADDRDEQDAADANATPYQPNDWERPPVDDAGPGPETSAADRGEQNAGESNAGEATSADVADPAKPDAEPETPGRPQEGTLLARILKVIEASDRPRRSWQIERELGMSRPLSSELSKLVKMGFLVRLREGVFGLAERNYPDYENSVPTELTNSPD
jgi:hypothetical protein